MPAAAIARLLSLWFVLSSIVAGLLACNPGVEPPRRDPVARDGAGGAAAVARADAAAGNGGASMVELLPGTGGVAPTAGAGGAAAAGTGGAAAVGTGGGVPLVDAGESLDQLGDSSTVLDQDARLDLAPDGGGCEGEAGEAGAVAEAGGRDAVVVGGGDQASDDGGGGDVGGGLADAPALPACARGVVLSQLYSRGGNAGAAYDHDFVELHNRGPDPIALGGWSIQYASAAGASWSVTALPDVALAGGGYFLVQGASGGAAGAALAGADASGTFNLGGAAGKVALVAGTAPLDGACPPARALLDLVGYGDATCFEGSPAPSPPAAAPIARRDRGCADTGGNGDDFAAGGPGPRTSAAPAVVCDCPGAGG